MMRWHAQHPWAMWCNVWIMATRTWLTNERTAPSHVSVHVRCVEGTLSLVSCSVSPRRRNTKYTLYSFLDFAIHFCVWSHIVFRQFLSVANSYTPVGCSRPRSTVNAICNKNSLNSWKFFRRIFPITASTRSNRLPIPPCRKLTLCCSCKSKWALVVLHLLLVAIVAKQAMHAWNRICASMIRYYNLAHLNEATICLVVEVLLCCQMVSVIFIRKSIPSSTKIFVSMIFNHSNTEFLIS